MGSYSDLPEFDEANDTVMRQDSALGTMDLVAQGKDPLYNTPRFGGPVTPQIAMESRFIFERKRNQAQNTVLSNPQNRWKEYTDYVDGVMKEYQAKNQTALMKAPRNRDEAVAQMMQLRPVTKDPTEIANQRSILMNMDRELKKIDPHDSVFTNPKTKKYADWLSREAGGGMLGYVEAGEQQIHAPDWESLWVNPIAYHISKPALKIWSATVDPALQFGTNLAKGVGDLTAMGVNGLWDLGEHYLRGVSNGAIEPPQKPTNYMKGPDGEIHHNGGKVPSVTDLYTMMYAAATDRNIEQTVADVGRTLQLEEQTAHGWNWVGNAVANVTGTLSGMALSGGPAMKLGTMAFGGLLNKGATMLAGKYLMASERAEKVVRAIAGGTAAGLGNAGFEAVTYGNMEGYGKAALHGFVATFPMLLIGAAKGRLEWALRNRPNKPPEFITRQVAAAAEGIGFGAFEAFAPSLMPEAWGFIQDPSKSTWEIMAKNVAGFLAFHNIAGPMHMPSPAQMSIEAVTTHVSRGTARRQFAEKLVGGEVSPEQAPAGSEANLRALGEMSKKLRTAAPEEAWPLRERMRAVETELDVEEHGLRGKAQTEAEKIAAEEEPTANAAELLMAAQKRVRTATTREARQEAIGDVKRLEGIVEGRKGPELVPGYRSDERDTPGGKETFVRGPEGDVVSTFSYEPMGDKALILNMETAKEHQGKGIMRAILQQKAKEFPGGFELSSPLTEASVATFKKAGLPVPEFREAGGGAEAAVKARQGVAPTGRRAGPQSLQQPPTTKIAPEPGVQPVRASDIMLEMQGRPGRKGFRIPFTGIRVGAKPGDVVQTAFREGKIGNKGAMGLFKFYENLARTQEGRDLVVSAHEWSHAMQRHAIADTGREFPKAARNQLAQALQFDPTIAAEMKQVLKDYPGADKLSRSAQWMETWAEWHARNLLGEVGLDVKFPALGKFMRGWLAQPAQAALRGQYQRIQDMLYRYNAQGAVQRVRQSIVLGSDIESVSQKAQKAPLLQRAQDAITKGFFDDLVELKRSQEKWMAAVGRKPEDVSITEDPAAMFDALMMTASKVVEHYIMRGFETPEGHVKGMHEVMKSVKGREDDFVTYLVAVRNIQLWKKGKTTQSPPQDYVETIKKLQTANPDFRQASRDLKAWSDQMVDYIARSGNLDEEQAQRIKDAYVVYVPFFRALEGPRAHGQGRGVAERGSGLHGIKGSTLEIRDPLVALMESSLSMVSKAHQNMIVASLYKMAHGQEAGGLATVIPRTKVPHDHPVLQLLKAIEKGADFSKEPALGAEFGDMVKALADADALNDQTITTFTQKVIPTGERSVIAFTPRLTEQEIDRLVLQGANKQKLEQQNNKLQWLELDPKVYEALMGIDKNPLSQSPIMKWLQVPRDVVRFFATGVSPGFMVANMVRDAMSAPLFSKTGEFRPFGGFVKMVRGAILYHKNGMVRQLYEEAGVKTSSFLSEGRKRELAGQNKRWRDRFMDMADSAQRLFSHPENYLRIAEFKDTLNKALAEGKSPVEARMLALQAGREITVNFARAGIYSRMLNQLIPYFNAGLQGKRKFWGQLLWGGDVKGDAAKARVQRATVLNGLANITAVSTALWFLNKDEDWYQDLPDWRKVNYFNFKFGENIVSIPKPFEAGVIFGALPEIMLDHQVARGNPASLKRAAIDALGGYMEGVGSLLPAFLKPLVEIGTNYNFFTGRQITPEWISRATVPSEQATFYTTEAAKALSRAINGILTPTEVEHVLGSYTAGATTSAMRAFDEMMGLKDHPVAGVPWARFTKQAEHGQSAYVDKLYALSTHLDQLEGSEELSLQDKMLKRQVDEAKREISELRKQSRSGQISRGDAETKAYQLARPLVEESER